MRRRFVAEGIKFIISVIVFMALALFLLAFFYKIFILGATTNKSLTNILENASQTTEDVQTP